MRDAEAVDVVAHEAERDGERDVAAALSKTVTVAVRTRTDLIVTAGGYEPLGPIPRLEPPPLPAPESPPQ